MDWVDGAYRGIGMPKSTPPEARKKMADLWMALNTDPEMTALADKSGFELVNIGTDQMDAFMKDKLKIYTEGAQRLGLGHQHPPRLHAWIFARNRPLHGCAP